MSPKVKEICNKDPNVTCQFCQRSEVNSLEWGPMYQLSGVTVHYFCLMFSSQHQQNGSDNQGILGFLPKDIKKEIKRGKKLKCVFCSLKGATISCCEKQCETLFHYPCAFENNCNFQFIGIYDAFCEKHKETHEVTIPNQEWNCPICFCEVGEDDTPICPPCCKTHVVHRRCIMMQAVTHGTYLFKCPFCDDEEIFSVAMRRLGIYVPHRDATWETVPNAFAEHATLYSTCDAITCQCPKGRDFDKKQWKVVRCGACAASAIHKRCGNLQKSSWQCPTCADILSGNQKCENSVMPDLVATFSRAIGKNSETILGTNALLTASNNMTTASTVVHRKFGIFDGHARRHKVVEIAGSNSNQPANSTDLVPKIRNEKNKIEIFDGRTRKHMSVEIAGSRSNQTPNSTGLVSANRNEKKKIEVFDGCRGLHFVVGTPSNPAPVPHRNPNKRCRRQVNYELQC